MERLILVLVAGVLLSLNPAKAHAEKEVLPSEFCRYLKRELETAKNYYHRGQYLLASVKVSSLLHGACDAPSRIESKLIYSLSMAQLGEKDESLLPLREVELRESGENQRRLLFVRSYLLGVPTGELSAYDRGRLALWNVREDADEFRSELSRLESEPAFRTSLEEIHRDYRETRVKSPLVAGLASTFIPGAGQAYNGAWQSAGLSFVLNSIFLWATAEFIDKKMKGPAIAAGTVFSVTYLGNILSAVEGAQSVNRTARKPQEEKLKKVLLPEITVPVGQF